MIHQILYKTILLLSGINTNIALSSRIANTLINFPEMNDVFVNESVYTKIRYNRKTEDYRKALEISKMLLLNYHPDLKHGCENILALMFDMNLLWEMLIYVSLRKLKKTDMHVKAQASKNFWKPASGYSVGIKPEILIEKGEERYILDTKWKNLNGKNPSNDDLRQLYVYHDYFKAKKALVYSGEYTINKGYYYDTSDQVLSDKECSVIMIPPLKNISEWQRGIAVMVYGKWLNKSKD